VDQLKFLPGIGLHITTECKSKVTRELFLICFWLGGFWHCQLVVCNHLHYFFKKKSFCWTR